MENYLQEVGKVIEVTGSTAKVLLKRHSSCASCGACGMGKQPEIVFEARNEIGAKVGDRVLVEMSSKKLMKAAFLTYTFPLIMLIVGYLLGQRLFTQMGLEISKAENYGIFCGFLFLAVSFVALRWLDQRKRMSQRFQPRLVEVIGSDTV